MKTRWNKWLCWFQNGPVWSNDWAHTTLDFMQNLHVSSSRSLRLSNKPSGMAKTMWKKITCVTSCCLWCIYTIIHALSLSPTKTLKNHSPTGENVSQHVLTKSCNFNKKRGCCESSCRDFKESLKMHCGKTENQLHTKLSLLDFMKNYLCCSPAFSLWAEPVCMIMLMHANLLFHPTLWTDRLLLLLLLPTLCQKTKQKTNCT